MPNIYTWFCKWLNSSRTYVYNDYIIPKRESMPRRTIVKKNIKTQRFEKGNRVRAFGKTLKLNYGPASFKSG